MTAKMIAKRSSLLLSVCLLMTGCAPSIIGLAAGAGATVGIAAERPGGVRTAANDVRIKALISDKWFKYNLETFAKLNLTVDEGRVLITGIVQNPDARVEAVRLAWQVEGVTQVINEIRIADSESFTDHAQDAWITTRLRAQMTFDRDIQAINYSIDTVDGTVYLMGIAQDQAELDHVIDTARNIPHVKQVVSYVRKAGERAPGEAPPAANPRSSMTHTHPHEMAPPPSNHPASYAQPDNNGSAPSSDEDNNEEAPPSTHNDSSPTAAPYAQPSSSSSSSSSSLSSPSDEQSSDSPSIRPGAVESESLKPQPVQQEQLPP